MRRGDAGAQRAVVDAEVVEDAKSLVRIVALLDEAAQDCSNTSDPPNRVLPSWQRPRQSRSAYAEVMQVAGRPSWRLIHELDGQWPHVVLYVRDALGLVPKQGLAIPPPLSGPIPDHRALLDEGQRERAAGEWAVWWAQMLDSEQRVQCWSREANLPKAFHEVVEEAGRAVEPSTAPVLADTTLRPVALTLFEEGSRWINDVRLSAPSGSNPNV